MSGQWHGGKGSKPRPLSVPTEDFDNRWDIIFGKKEKKKQEDEQEVEDVKDEN